MKRLCFAVLLVAASLSFGQGTRVNLSRPDVQGQLQSGNCPAVSGDVQASAGACVTSVNPYGGVATKAGIQQQAYVCADDTGTANSYAVAISPVPTIGKYQIVCFKAAHANTGASTITVNGGSAYALTKNGTTPLSGNEIYAGQVITVINDGSGEYQIATGSAGSGGSQGPQGVQGPTGSAGPQGAQGAMGTPGSVLYNGVGIPTTTHNDGDYYINVVNDDVYRQFAGSWGSPVFNLKGATGSQGPQGAAGPQGSTGPQGAAGANGTSGARWYEGAGVPSTTHNDGDYYFNTANGDVYTQAAGAWGSPVGNIKGSPGPTGSQGPQGTVGATGPQGTQGIQGTAGPTGSQGPQGPNGPAGPQGPAGGSTTWLQTWNSGTTYHAASYDAITDNGSSYVAIADSTNHEPPNVTYWQLLALKGADGSQGIAGPQGVAGAAGATGATGSQGPQGTVGATGATGATGSQGPQGVVGPQGASGGSTNWRGTYASGTTYAQIDAIAYGSPASSYIS